MDAESGLVHTVVGTAANVNDVTQASALVHGEETDVFADAGYQGVAKREETQDIECDWHVAMRPGKRRALDKNTPMGAIMDKLEKTKASIRAKVEHPFRVIKRQFGHVKVRYRGLDEEHGATAHAVRALQSLDGAAQAFEQGAGMSASAERPMGRDVASKRREIDHCAALKSTSAFSWKVTKLPSGSRIANSLAPHGFCESGALG